MANRRMIAKSISVSDETNSISLFAALLFTWMIPHTDDYGIIAGTAGRIKALVVPRLNQTESDVEAALEEIRAVGLIHRYTHNGHSYSQFVNFEQHQEGLHKRTSPKNPCWNDEGSQPYAGSFREVPKNSRLTEPNLTEPNPRERNLNELNPTELRASEAELVIADQLAKNVCRVSSATERGIIRAWLATYSQEWVVAAIQSAALNKAGSVKYVDAILKAWGGKYGPADKPWEHDRHKRQRASPGKSFAMSKLEQMAKDAVSRGH
jgi:DnaD/phage-associated family protein